MEIAGEVPARRLGGVNFDRAWRQGLLPPREHGYAGFALRTDGFEKYIVGATSSSRSATAAR